MSNTNTISNMKKIAAELQVKNASDEEKWIEVKTGWSYYKHSENMQEILTTIEKVVETHPTRLKIGSKELAENTTISDERTKSLNENITSEVYLERLITKSNSGFYNQLCVGVGNVESIDLVYVHSETAKLWLIELKTTSNTPLYAFIEIIKNYYLLKAINPEKAENVEKLVLLAPKFYFQKFKPENSKFKNTEPIQEFYKTIDEFKKESGLDFSIYYLNIENETGIKEVLKKDPNILKQENWELLNEEKWLNL